MNTRIVRSRARRRDARHLVTPPFHANGARHSPGRWSTTLLLAVLILAGVSSEAVAQTRNLLIVSAGESYASGEGAPDAFGGHNGFGMWNGDYGDGASIDCHRSSNAAAHVTVESLRTIWPVDFASVACSGAVTNRGAITWLTSDSPSADADHVMVGTGGQLWKIKHLIQEQRFNGRPIDALVMSIGGNDLGFDKIVTSCMVPDPPVSLGCQAWLDGLVAQEMVELPHRLRELIDAVNSGEAGTIRHVFLVPYPDPTTGALGLRCGLPHLPLTDGGMDGITYDEATWASTRVIAPLNAALAAAVGEANKSIGSGGPQWHLVTGVTEAFQGHGYCAFSADRFINTLFDSQLNQGDEKGTMHPNENGHKAIANVLTAAMWPLAVPQASFVGQSVPAVMLPGHTYPVSITMRNSGTVVWRPEDAIRLGSQSPQDNMTWGVGRVALPAVVGPGQEVIFTFNVTAPAQPGVYAFQWRMVQEAVQWFGELTPRVNVPVRQMTLDIKQNSQSVSAANITVTARDAATGALLGGTVTLDGVVVAQLGQAFSYTRSRSRVCETIDGRPICTWQYESREFQVDSPGYIPVSFWRF